MLKKYAIFTTIFVVFSLLTLSSFAQGDTEHIVQEKISGVAQMRGAVEKLKRGMTVAEVEELIGKPTFESSSYYYYWFNNEEYMTLYYSSGTRLYSIYNKHMLNLLDHIHDAKIADFPIIIDDKEMDPLHPVMYIQGGTYISIKDFEAAFGVKATFGEKKELPETDFVGVYKPTIKVITTNFSVFIDGKELFTVSPVMTINDEVYIPIEELEKDFQIKTVREMSTFQSIYQPLKITSLEIKTGVPFVADLNERKDHLAMVTDLPVFINEKEFLTLNPTVIINGKIYLPVEDLQEHLEVAAYRDQTTEFVFRSGLYSTYETTTHGIDIITDKDMIKAKNEEIKAKKEQAEGADFGHGIGNSFRDYSIDKTMLDMYLVIMKDIDAGVQADKEHAGVIKFKADVAKLRRGMTHDEVEEILGKTEKMPRPNSAIGEIIYPYRHEDGERLNLAYDRGLSYAENKNRIDLLSTGYNAYIPNYPILINGENPLIKNPILNIREVVYIPIEDFSEYFNINVSFNEEKERLEITKK